MKLIFATHNSGKVKEMKALLADFKINVLSAEEAGIFEDVIEDGDTFEKNALKKAYFISEKTGEFSVADDSGICIDALDGKPGIMSARWAGENASDEDIVNYTIKQIENIDDKKLTARFTAVLALSAPDGKNWFFKGVIEGKVVKSPRGKNRAKLPYDMIFIPEGHKRTFAEMTDEEKNSLSHRGIAFRKLKEFLKDFND
ncbi:RdgB/HAM1 family non-canonical purine NTP pyrophosphatase [Patescibacteria group bacterium]